ncbi:MAG TPA: alkaline shock response membrane anchor protein AmaP [Thermoflexia bacterium]|nr:alkaline shock response membrane anchor protein AmaP [Thermoflexia bacterium]
MNAVNRILVVVLLLIAIPLCTILLVLPIPVLEAIGGQLTALIDFLSRLQWYVRVPLGILFALTLDVIFILLIILEVRRPTPKAIRVEKAAGGEVQISVASIADRLKYEVDQLPGILRSKAKVSARRKGVVVELDVETAAGVDVPERAEQIVETARRVVEEKMGLKLARPPKVNLRAVPYPTTPRGRSFAVEEPPAYPSGGG